MLLSKNPGFVKRLMSFSCRGPQVKAFSVQNEGTQIQIRVYSKTKWQCQHVSSIWGLFFFLLTMQPQSSKYKRHCFLQVVCDKGINLFSLNDIAFLNRLVAEAILWKKKILGNCERISWKYAPNPYSGSQSGCSCYLRPHAHEGGCCRSLLLTFLLLYKVAPKPSPPASKVIVKHTWSLLFPDN